MSVPDYGLFRTKHSHDIPIFGIPASTYGSLQITPISFAISTCIRFQFQTVNKHNSNCYISECSVSHINIILASVFQLEQLKKC